MNFSYRFLFLPLSISCRFSHLVPPLSFSLHEVLDLVFDELVAFIICSF